MEILAPLSGLLVPLDAVPDEVFARGLAGEGVAIDPTSEELLAPIAGRVTQLHRAHHALAITSDDGVEILVHVGLDTVTLAGRGFTPLVSLGARVERGQPVLRFDADQVALAGHPLLTPVVVTSGGRVARMERARGLVEAGRSTILRLEPAAAGPASPRAPVSVSSEPIALPHREGLHTRPAAVLASHARRYPAEIRLRRGGDEVNAKSVVAIMGLSTRQGELVQLEASGDGAAEAIAELSRLLAKGCGEREGEAPPPRPTGMPAAAPQATGELAGVAASPGVAIGRLFQHRRDAAVREETGRGAAVESARLGEALRAASLQLEGLERGAGILTAHRALLEDPELLALAGSSLAQGKSAAFAWHEACATHAARLEALDNPLLRERAGDLRDVGRRVVALLAGVQPARVALPEGSVVVAEELGPSELIAFERGRLLGLCTTTGSVTSHVAILARGMGIPAICGIDPVALSLPAGVPVVIDGTRGLLQVSPDEISLAQARERMAREAAQRTAESGAALRLARTRDGHRVEVVANIGNLEEARAALAAGAEGVGLLRTEMLFQDRETAPSEDEQAAIYLAIAQAIGKDRPFVVRTLDVGGDKPLPYLPLAEERNPFLGLRGIRVSLERPELFRAQLRAILRAAAVGNVHIMFPMIAGLEEVRAARRILAEEQRAIPASVSVGVMVEVPSAAALAEPLAREVDFFSIGTNDLTQYALAMDRGHPLLARQADALHPAVLRLMAMTVAGARQHGRWVGVCGGIASDPLAAPLLVGLGVNELSVGAPAIGSIKAELSRWSLAECQALAAEVLALGTAAEVRALLTARRAAAGTRPPAGAARATMEG